MPKCDFTIVPPAGWHTAIVKGHQYHFKTDPPLEFPCKQTYQLDKKAAESGGDVAGFYVTGVGSDGSITLTATKDGGAVELKITRACAATEGKEAYACNQPITIGSGLLPAGPANIVHRICKWIRSLF